LPLEPYQSLSFSLPGIPSLPRFPFSFAKSPLSAGYGFSQASLTPGMDVAKIAKI
jgi:hypothetical protein